MRNLLVCFSLFMAYSASASDFWGDRTETKFINGELKLTQGLDMAEFHENFSRTTSELRQQYIYEAERLMKAGASGGEALEMVLAFDDRVYDRRQIAKRGMGKTIAGYFKSGLNNIYDTFEDQGGQRLLEISSVGGNYKPHLLWGVMPGAGIYAVLELYNEETGITRSFAARTKVQHIDALGKTLALLVFHSLHKTRFPLEKRVGYKTLVVKGIRTLKTTGYVQHRNMLQSIEETCKAKNSRMATLNEMKSLLADGFYQGGLSMGKFRWAAKKAYGYAYISAQYPLGTDQALTNSPFDRTMKYICVQEK